MGRVGALFVPEAVFLDPWPLPVDVIILMHAVKLQFKATQQILDHDP